LLAARVNGAAQNADPGKFSARVLKIVEVPKVLFLPLFIFITLTSRTGTKKVTAISSRSLETAAFLDKIRRIGLSRQSVYPLEFGDKLRSDIFVVNDEKILIVFGFCAVCEVVRAENYDALVYDHYFVVHKAGVCVLIDIQTRLTKAIELCADV
jgi:hypothetical protein